MVSYGNPFSDAAACFLEVAYCQVDELCRGLVGWEAAARFGIFSNDAIQTFNRFGGVDDFAHGWWEGKKWNDLLPCAPP